MKLLTKIVALLMLLALLVTSTLIALAAPLEINELPRANDVSGSVTGVPDYTLQTLDGNELRLSSLRGKVVLLDFFNAHCKHCQAHAPFVASLAKRYKNLTVVNLASNNPFVDADAVATYKTTANIDNVIAWTPQELFAAYLTPDAEGIIGVPQAVLFDQSGKVVARFTKWQDADKPAIETMIAKYVKQ